MRTRRLASRVKRSGALGMTSVTGSVLKFPGKGRCSGCGHTCTLSPPLAPAGMRAVLRWTRRSTFPGDVVELTTTAIHAFLAETALLFTNSPALPSVFGGNLVGAIWYLIEQMNHHQRPMSEYRASAEIGAAMIAVIWVTTMLWFARRHDQAKSS